MEHKIVSRITEGAFRYQAWPTITKDQNGVLYLATSGHRLSHVCPFGKNLMYTSYDDGKTWSAPQIINDTWLDDRDAGILAWGEGKLLLTWFNHPPKAFLKWDAVCDKRPHYKVRTPLSLGMRALWDDLPEEEKRSGSFSKISYDNGKTWSEPRPAPITSPHGPCLLSDGSLFWLGKEMEGSAFPSLETEKRIVAYRSADEGKTWEFVSATPKPLGAEGDCHEPYAIQLSDGTILGSVRYHHGKGVAKTRTFLFSSNDNGKTWSEAEFVNEWGSPPHLLEHSSGAIILVYGKRSEVMGQYARASLDKGKTWSKEALISSVAPDWDHGYPSSVELSNGDILTAYYQKYSGDDYTSLHTSRWSLKELL